ncbi:MAG: cytochrome b [Azospirillaceae bacterium]|nr:cytochrome b [Azospirillaceae bacterium]
MSRSRRYDAGAIAIHWLTALAVIALLAMGLTMTSLRPGSALQFSLYQWHKSVGITVLALSLIRLLWRLAHRAPALPASMAPWEQWAAHAGHLALYGLLFAMPLTGWAVVSASPYNIPTVLYGLIPFPHLPILATLQDKKPVLAVLEQIHSAGAWIMIATLVGHIAAALRHQFLLRDGVMERMLPRFGRRSGTGISAQEL